MTDPFNAVPPPGHPVPEMEKGMTLREWYAGIALQAVCDKSLRNLVDCSDKTYEDIARGAVRLADAMIAELNSSGK